MKYFKRFSDCFPIKGYCRSTIYDIHRKDVLMIDNIIFGVLNHDFIPNKLLKILPQETIEDLLEKEIIFPILSKEASLFPPIKTSFISPFHVDSCIIDVEHDSKFDIYKILDQLDNLGCRVLQLRFSSSIQFNVVHEILSHMIAKNIRCLELVLPFEEIIAFELTNKYKMVSSITMYGAPQYDYSQINSCSIISTKEQYYGVEQCGIIEPNYFVCNREIFFESLSCNSCLNQKISVTAKGEIKNCPSCAKSYGNISDTSLEQVLENPDFKKLWSITKDQIDVCKDCEFRHMCTDCRAYIKDPENIYSQPAKCNYNPYIAKWKGEDGYVTIEECGAYSRETGFVVNINKVETINHEFWDS